MTTQPTNNLTLANTGSLIRLILAILSGALLNKGINVDPDTVIAIVNAIYAASGSVLGAVALIWAFVKNLKQKNTVERIKLQSRL